MKIRIAGKVMDAKFTNDYPGSTFGEAPPAIVVREGEKFRVFRTRCEIESAGIEFVQTSPKEMERLVMRNLL